ncbi:peptidoglycan glycosyltransferase [Flavipsychrobacter stenotrophus]|uniref:Peptidoglycan glycosyltransferase n=1 Tax=Flavipsychrobacter stenotrophus TaxID=2077091 RepID=A0A2S7SS50_9BACT|nr:transglycosylase domain-containing protein [Flavipsychrobacter stenotrophus]PQJ09425.1 peptidoglycan glycosyltransferase [Flavipsychrobacter stenotrophus]
MKNQPEKPKVKTRAKRSVRILWRSFIVFLVSLVLLVVAIDHGLIGYMPSMIELENPQSALSSDVYAADGTILGRYYVQDRSNCKFSEVSPNIINALIATEDARFYDHAGIDPIATVRIFFRLGRAGGGSTISQQLAKNLFPREKKSFLTLPFVKLKEWVLAVKLERNLTKNELITLYLNIVPFGDNVFGIRNASLTFYNKTPDKVTVDEAAVLVGMLKGNTMYNPRKNPERAKNRRNTVLDQMVKYNYLTEGQADSFKDHETPLNYHKIDYHDGIAPYFRQVLESQVKAVLKDMKKPDGTPYDLYKDGLKIYTTIDVRMQRYAEEAMQEHLTELQKQFMAQNGYRDGSIWTKGGKSIDNILTASIKASDRYQSFRDINMTEKQAMAMMAKPNKTKVFAWNKLHYKDTTISPIDSIKYMKTFLQSGFMAMDPFTGEVKAWVGGIDHTFFQFDHVNVNTKRQVGSTIKPLLYSFAVDNGFSPCGIVQTSPQSFPSMPKPYDAQPGESFGDVPMKYALAKSLNNAALYILKQVGIDAFVDFAHKCNITSRMDKFPSVGLGVSDISLYEMMGAYTMFPAGGTNTQPYFMVRIEDKNGMLVKNFAPTQKEVINPNTAFKMVKMMQGVVDFGTGGRMRHRYGLMNQIAGKTGTTNNQADAWFIGYTPQLLAGAWVGCDDRQFRFRSEALGQGAAAALPIWAFFMKRVYADKNLNITPNATFKAPDGFDDCGIGTDGGGTPEDKKGKKTGADDEVEEHGARTPANNNDDYE